MTRRATRLVAVLAVCVTALALSAGTASTASAAKKMEVALQDDATFLIGLRSPFTALKKARQLHVRWLRVTLTWSSVVHAKQRRLKKAPKRVKYRWRAWDDIVMRARRRGIKVQLNLTGPAPRWASGKRKVSNYKPSAKRFGSFSRAVAKHFNSKRVRVSRFLIWNEPNLKAWLTPQRRAASMYRQLYSQAYRNIKAVNKRNQVLIGETAPYGQRGRTIAPLKFIRQVTCVNSRWRKRRNCKALRTDGYAHHPYDYKHKPTFRYPGRDNVTIATLSRLTKALSRLRRARALTTPSGGVPFVYLTEYGYFSAARKGSRASKYNISKTRHARYLVKAFSIARKNKRVKQMLQFLLVTPPKKYNFFQTQIMTSRFKPYAPFNALRKWTDREAKRGGILK